MRVLRFVACCCYCSFLIGPACAFLSPLSVGVVVVNVHEDHSILISNKNVKNRKGLGQAEHSDDTAAAATSASSPSSPGTPDADANGAAPEAAAAASSNSRYITGLLATLSHSLDRWIVTGAPAIRDRVSNLLRLIQTEAHDTEQIAQARRMVTRAGFSLEAAQPAAQPQSDTEKRSLGSTDADARRSEAQQRTAWESRRTSSTGTTVAKNLGGRSALTQRSATATDAAFLGKVLDHREMMNANDPRKVAQDKVELEQALASSPGQEENNPEPREISASSSPESDEAAAASVKVSELVARAGHGASFDGHAMGIGGLDHVLAQVKRRVWTPLAAPPQLLSELGIQPVRGLLLYGQPGCGKTLLARTLGRVLSPLRPVTVVSGPEIMDRYVGSSEKNLRAVFDNPPDIYDTYRIGEKDGGDAVAQEALHVVVLDEFDAIARSRGGSGNQGDAGVARDSVVNQLLAKMDGVDALPVKTLVIGLTNKRSLIDPALLRPGRFEVQIEVPPPKTIEQRVSILKVHTKHMFESGRLLVQDAPTGSAASIRNTKGNPSYLDLLERLAERCEGYTGASLAGVVRAAASRALERSVEEFSQNPEKGSLMDLCIVSEDDLINAVQDSAANLTDDDWAEEEDGDASQAVENNSQEAASDKNDTEPAD